MISYAIERDQNKGRGGLMRVSSLIQSGIGMFRQLANRKECRTDDRLCALRNFPSPRWLSHREKEPLPERKADTLPIHDRKAFPLSSSPATRTDLTTFCYFLSPTGLKCYIFGLRLRSRTYSTRSSSGRWQVDSRRRRLQPLPASAPAHRLPGGPRRDALRLAAGVPCHVMPTDAPA